MINIPPSKHSTGIYKITNPKGKYYIGSSINIERRFLNYKYKQCKQQIKLYNSLKKYGPENHIFEIIEVCEKNELIEKEIYWVNKFNLTNLQKQKKCFHFSNLQPLFTTTEIAESYGYKDEIGNRNKSNKI